MFLMRRRDIMAVGIVLSIAVLSTEGLVAAKIITKRLGLPVRHLEPLLQALSREGILEGFRGPDGGYRLARDPKAITIEDIVAAAETINQSAKSGASWSPLLKKVVLPAVEQAERAWLTALASITMEELLKAANRR
jgi:Rrf2 family iron-sulfur cluster assembly transcriptional regulator